MKVGSAFFTQEKKIQILATKVGGAFIMRVRSLCNTSKYGISAPISFQTIAYSMEPRHPLSVILLHCTGECINGKPNFVHKYLFQKTAIPVGVNAKNVLRKMDLKILTTVQVINVSDV